MQARLDHSFFCLTASMARKTTIHVLCSSQKQHRPCCAWQCKTGCPRESWAESALALWFPLPLCPTSLVERHPARFLMRILGRDTESSRCLAFSLPRRAPRTLLHTLLVPGPPETRPAVSVMGCLASGPAQGASSTQVTESSRSLALPLFREASRTTRQPL